MDITLSRQDIQAGRLFLKPICDKSAKLRDTRVPKIHYVVIGNKAY